MVVSKADARRMQKQPVAPSMSLAKSNDVVQNVSEAGHEIPKP
jgi:hypothetical protein